MLLDSLNRHLLGAYGGTEFDTPNLDRLAARSVRFTNHHTGLAAVHAGPPRPAGRRPRLPVAAVGLDRGVGGRHHPPLLRRDAGISTMLVSDHPHLFETGGENYHADFGAWDYLRGHEDDPWRTRPDPSFVGSPTVPAAGRGPVGRGPTTSPAPGSATRPTSPGPRTMAAAAAWLDRRARRRRGPTTSGPSSWSTSSTRTSRSTRPRRWADALRRRLGGRAPDLAALRARTPSRPGSTERAGPAPAGAVRRQALDDRPLARPHPRRRRPPRRLGHHRVRRSAPTTATTSASAASGASRRCPCTPSSGHIPLLVAWPGVAAGDLRRAHHHRRPPRHALRRVRRDARAPHPRAVARARCSRARRRRSASGRCAACGAARCTSPTPPAPTPGSRSRATGRCRCGRTAGRRCRSAPSPTSGMPRPDDRAWLDRVPGQRRAGDPPAVRPERRASRSGPWATSRASCSTTGPSATPRRGARPPRRRRRRPRRPRRWPTSWSRPSAPSRPPTEQLVRLGPRARPIADAVPEAHLDRRVHRLRPRRRARRRASCGWRRRCCATAPSCWPGPPPTRRPASACRSAAGRPASTPSPTAATRRSPPSSTEVGRAGRVRSLARRARRRHRRRRPGRPAERPTLRAAAFDPTPRRRERRRRRPRRARLARRQARRRSSAPVRSPTPPPPRRRPNGATADRRRCASTPSATRSSWPARPACSSTTSPPP